MSPSFPFPFLLFPFLLCPFLHFSFPSPSLSNLLFPCSMFTKGHDDIREVSNSPGVAQSSAQNSPLGAHHSFYRNRSCFPVENPLCKIGLFYIARRLLTVMHLPPGVIYKYTLGKRTVAGVSLCFEPVSEPLKQFGKHL